MKKLTWVLAHEPYNIFLKAATHFANRIAEESNGQFQIDVKSLAQYNEQTGAELTAHAADRTKVIELVNNGTIDMATVYVNSLGKIHNDLYALGMPFLFNDHVHSEKVLDGKIGSHLLRGIETKSNVKGLAFTYSGGFRIIPSQRAIERLEDFYDLQIRCGLSPVAVDTFESVGAKPQQILIDDFAEAFDSNTVQAGETTYPRFFALGHDKSSKVINHTEHSLFLTSIVTNTKVWNELDSNMRSLFADAALEAAKIERQESLADIDKVQLEAARQGIETVKMTTKERERFARATSGLYTKYDSIFESGLLKEIKKAV